MITDSKIELAKDNFNRDIAIQTHASEPPESNKPSYSQWVARAVIVSVAGALAWHTWGHWGDFQIDSGREIYVPAAILQGKLLFRDLWYMYGPLAPYVQAILFRIFGVHLTVLYLFGLALTVGSALVTFEISRQFDLDLAACMVPPLLFLLEAFYPFIFNFVFPYSYAATLASFLGLTCLYFAIRHAKGMRPMHLGLAALFGSLALLTKQEFGAACVLLLAFEAVAPSLVHRSARELGKNIAVCFTGLLPAMAGYGWFTWKLSAKLIYFDNWISTPGTYFMRTFSKRTMASQGLRFKPWELISSLEMAVLTMLLWFALGYINAMAIKKRRLQPRFAFMVLFLDILIAMVIILHGRGPADPLYVFLAQSIYPKGIFFLGLYFTGQAIWKLWRDPRYISGLPDAALGIYATLVGVRVMMELTPSMYNYAVFFNVPIFLVFIILVVKAVRLGAGSLELKTRDLLVTCLLAAELVLLSVRFFPQPRRAQVPLATGYGTFYTRPDVATLFPQIVSFMKAHTKNGKDILVIPEPPSLYTFAGMQAPTQWYSLLPGIVDPSHEQEFIREAMANDVRFVLISNRTVVEYGVDPFGVGFNQQIYRWIMANYRMVGRFGPLPNSFPDAYIMNIFERKDIEPIQ